jgi:5'/3'-nucleotidase SurE
MNILLTNDDGFDADGIKAIRTALEKSHNVYVVAPEKIAVALVHLSRTLKKLKSRRNQKDFTLLEELRLIAHILAY